jgi:hypothetical protein
MSNDIFILNTDTEGCKNLLKRYPSARVIEHQQLTQEALTEIINSSFTRFFYVVDAIAPIETFDFSYRPNEYEEDYVHVWESSDVIRLFQRKTVANNPNLYTDAALRRGRIELLFHENKVYSGTVRKIRNEPDVFILSPTNSIGRKFLDKANLHGDRFKIIESKFDLTADTMDKILNSCESYYFYVVSARIELLSDFDFTFVPDFWDKHYVHIWDNNLGIRLLNKPDVEKNIDGYTDMAWKQGQMVIKNIPFKIFNIRPFNVVFQKDSDIFVIGNAFNAKGLTNKIHYMDDINTDYIRKNSSTPCFYVVSEGVEVENFDFQFLPEEDWELEHIHVWDNRKHIQFCSLAKLEESPDVLENPRDNIIYHDEKIYTKFGRTWPIYQSMDEALTNNTKDYFFIMDDDVIFAEDFPFDFVPEMWDEDKAHVWQRINPHTNTVYDYSGVLLYPRGWKEGDGIQYVREAGCIGMPFDVIMLSYKEPFADKMYDTLVQKVPRAKRIHGVKGIFEAHKAAAELATTPMFYVVDADAKLTETFDFSFMPRKSDYHKVFVWRSQNPINNLVYGYGGVKLFPRDVILNTDTYNIDFTTSISEDFVPIAEISNTTMIDIDPFTAWKSAFRECVKLSSKVIKDQNDRETEDRLNTWCTMGKDSKNGKYAIRGALEGKEYGMSHAENKDKLEHINDHEWLLKRWEESNK